MKTPSLGVLAFGTIALTAILLAAIGAPRDRTPTVAAAAPPAPPPSSVSAGGFTLTSASGELPIDAAKFPDGPNVDVVTANCAACHSVSMVTNQPALSEEQWKAVVTKMRKIYKAPVAKTDVTAIVTYLTAMPGQRPGLMPIGASAPSETMQ